MLYRVHSHRRPGKCIEPSLRRGGQGRDAPLGALPCSARFPVPARTTAIYGTQGKGPGALPVFRVKR